MTSIKTLTTTDNNASSSRCIAFINTPVSGRDGNPLNGEITLNDGKGTIVRFVDGLIDGNVYDEDGKVTETRPAVEYEKGGREYWTRGRPDGCPAVIQNDGFLEEDWRDGHIMAIRNEFDLDYMEADFEAERAEA